MLGSDHPIPREQHPVDHVFTISVLTNKEKTAILGLKVACLFNSRTS
jgi:aminocarboxymuconate-semialdehyde decarboxylase